MANDLLFPSGPAYSDLTGRPGVKLFAVDDATNPATPVPGYVVVPPQSATPSQPGQSQPFTFDQQ